MMREKFMLGVKNLLTATAGVTLLSLGTVEIAQAAEIDTTAGWLGEGYIFENSRYGQVFTVPKDNVINSFSFFLSSVESPPTEFTAHLAPWNPTTFESAVDIYSSDSQSVAGLPRYTATPSSYAEITFNTGAISLLAGQQYVAYLNVETPGSGAIGYNFDQDSYSEGYGLYYSKNNAFWYNNGDNRDYSFNAAFSTDSKTVPEPSLTIGTVMISTFLMSKIIKRGKNRG